MTFSLRHRRVAHAKVRQAGRQIHRTMVSAIHTFECLVGNAIMGTNIDRNENRRQPMPGNMRDHAKKLKFCKIRYAAGSAGSNWSISDLTGVKKRHLLVTSACTNGKARKSFA
jgi:hypothetical protein